MQRWKQARPGAGGPGPGSIMAGLLLGGLLLWASQSSVLRAQDPDPDDLPGRGPWVPSWEVLVGGFRQIEDLAVVSADEAWGIDRAAFLQGGRTVDQTAFVHFNGGVWRVAQIANGVYPTAIDIAGERGFVVGKQGAIYRLELGKWIRQASPTAQDLLDLDLWSEEEGWASGRRGTILRFDGSGWRASDLPEDYKNIDIKTVAGAGPGRAFAVTEKGEILRYAEGAWSMDPAAPRLERPSDIAFASAEHGLFVGRGAIRYRSGIWSQAGLEDVIYDSVAFVGETAYVTGSGEVARLTAAGEASFPTLSPYLASLLYARVVPAPGGVYALGAAGSVVRIVDGQPGEYLRPGVDPFDAIDAVAHDFAWAGGEVHEAGGFRGDLGAGWTREQALPRGARVTDIDLASRTDGWSVGTIPNSIPNAPPLARMWRWDGGSWKVFPIDKTWAFYDVQVIDEGEAWASGAGVIARWEGGDEWNQVFDAPSEAASGAMSILEGGTKPQGWFGGLGSIHRLEGEEWFEEPIEAGYWVPRMHVTARNEGWAIAKDVVSLDENGRPERDARPDRLYRYDGETWTEASIPIPDDVGLLDVDSPVPGTVWVLVELNGLLHWTGDAWEFHVLGPLGESIQPKRVRALQLGENGRDISIWLAGGRPTIARYGVVLPEHVIHLPLLGALAR